MHLAFSPALALIKRTVQDDSVLCRRHPCTRFNSQRRRRRWRSVPLRLSRNASHMCTQPSSSLSFSVGSSKQYRILDALKESITQASRSLAEQGCTATLVIIFIKSSSESHPADDCSRVISVAKKILAINRVLSKDTKFFGCTTGNHPGSEKQSAMVALMHLPEESELRTFYVDPRAFNLDWAQQQWYNMIGGPPAQTRQETMMILCHPDFDATAEVLSSLDFAFPGMRKLGASAGHGKGLDQVYLFNCDGAVKDGVIGLCIASRDVQVDVTVAQGARGVGPMLEVLEVRNGNEITKVKEVRTAAQVEGAPMVLLDMWAGTDEITQEDREYARKYVLMGIEVPKVVDLAVASMSKVKEGGTKEGDAEEEKTKPVEMVIRKVVGFDTVAGSVGVEGGDVRLGSRIQFQIRDEGAARTELGVLFNRLMLEGSHKMMDGMCLLGALLIVDSERGENLYGDIAADTDRQLYAERFAVPMAILTSEQQIGPLPAGGLLGAAGNSFLLSASALYVSFYGRALDGNGGGNGDGNGDGNGSGRKES